ncbi:trihelix transcription factor ASIL2 [Forsythia ovata]|uniref:Trihelix transcription factor ASIL2 n=1 Tax=Forsythia ovata TaxID=205694 RepID=A0ABD1VNJ0_9LAMI
MATIFSPSSPSANDDHIPTATLALPSIAITTASAYRHLPPPCWSTDEMVATVNSSAVEYPLGLKLIGLHIEDVSFATDETERHLEVENTGYENYDSSAKRHLLVSLVLFLRIYYKGGMLGEQSANLSRASVITEGQSVG